MVTLIIDRRKFHVLNFFPNQYCNASLFISTAEVVREKRPTIKNQCIQKKESVQDFYFLSLSIDLT